MAVAVDDGDAGGEVDIAATFDIPYLGVLGAVGRDLRVMPTPREIAWFCVRKWRNRRWLSSGVRVKAQLREVMPAASSKAGGWRIESDISTNQWGWAAVDYSCQRAASDGPLNHPASRSPRNPSRMISRTKEPSAGPARRRLVTALVRDRRATVAGNQSPHRKMQQGREE